MGRRPTDVAARTVGLRPTLRLARKKSQPLRDAGYEAVGLDLAASPFTDSIGDDIRIMLAGRGTYCKTGHFRLLRIHRIIQKGVSLDGYY